MDDNRSCSFTTKDWFSSRPRPLIMQVFLRAPYYQKRLGISKKIVFTIYLGTSKPKRRGKVLWRYGTFSRIVQRRDKGSRKKNPPLMAGPLRGGGGRG